MPTPASFDRAQTLTNTLLNQKLADVIGADKADKILDSVLPMLSNQRPEDIGKEPLPDPKFGIKADSKTFTMRQTMSALSNLYLHDEFATEKSRNRARELNPAAFKMKVRETDIQRLQAEGKMPHKEQLDSVEEFIAAGKLLKSLPQPLGDYLSMMDALTALADRRAPVQPSTLRNGIRALDMILTHNSESVSHLIKQSTDAGTLEKDHALMKAITSTFAYVQHKSPQRPPQMPEDIYNEMLAIPPNAKDATERHSELIGRYTAHLKEQAPVSAKEYRQGHESLSNTANTMNENILLAKAVRDMVVQIAKSLDIKLAPQERA